MLDIDILGSSCVDPMNTRISKPLSDQMFLSGQYGENIIKAVEYLESQLGIAPDDECDNCDDLEWEIDSLRSEYDKADDGKA